MSRFYASIQGNRGEATRQGTPKSGIVGHIRGWHVGAYVNCDVGPNGEDYCDVWATSGSNGRYSRQLIATIKAGPNGPIIELVK